MVDLKGQYEKIKGEIDLAISQVISSSAFINGPVVGEFSEALKKYLGVGYVIPCANGTDALQIALMACGLRPGDEVLVPAFTYVASAEVIALLGLIPVMVDVDPATFNISIESMKKGLSDKTRAIIPVHLYGQSADMEPILEFAKEHSLFVIEDNAQALGSDYIFSDGSRAKCGTMGDIGTTSFFPSKNLGCYGDGGAIFTNDEELAKKLKMIANHGQSVKYVHSVVGCNSRLDSIQAAVLNVKLAYLDQYCDARREAAEYYNKGFQGLSQIEIPFQSHNSRHVYHQYTIKVKDGSRDSLKEFLAS
ncbi:MAG: DegT/DnrJ/EryC1/StrS family aminotransferase, partial [Bacteroidales bacterium]|nr:DegT/DnrJ/EryC1/StrS family aminotransferase [Bacteroidales bacterium]